jgi:uncharacterized protein YeaO (DUF488 family)
VQRLRVKRIYEPADDGDGRRVLVDRVWPRGVSKDSAALDLWLKDIAPSTELRKWFGHDPARWKEFQRRYHAELDKNETPVSRLLDLMKTSVVTLLYSARDAEHNQAQALVDYIVAHKKSGRKS